MALCARLMRSSSEPPLDWPICLSRTNLSQANLVGLPAISVPVGHDPSGLPIGLQFIGRPWAEATLLRMASVMESAASGRVRQQGAPAIWMNPLTGQSAGL